MRWLAACNVDYITDTTTLVLPLLLGWFCILQKQENILTLKETAKVNQSQLLAKACCQFTRDVSAVVSTVKLSYFLGVVCSTVKLSYFQGVVC